MFLGLRTINHPAPDLDAAKAWWTEVRLLELGAEPFLKVNEVGGGIRVAAVRDPAGSLFGVIENPHFALPESPPEQPGPGR